MSIQINLPQQFKERMQQLLGAEYEEFIASYEREKRSGLRVNTLKLTPEEFQANSPFALEAIPWAKDGFYYGSGERPGKHPYHDAGLYYIQEPSAMAAVKLCPPEPGQRVLDLCAAPGGKTTQLAAAMGGQGVLVANEIHPARARILSENIERLGVANAVVTNESPQALATRFPQWFDYILVDAPCSGEGMFLKEQEACGQWSPANVSMCAERQRDILACAAAMLAPGGKLVYSTCTFAPEENEGTIHSFLALHPEFVLKETESDIGEFLSAGRPEWAQWTAARPLHDGAADPDLCRCYRIWPHLLTGEGHFAAILEKEAEGTAESGAGTRKNKKANRKKGRNSGLSPDKTAMSLWKEFACENLKKIPEGTPVLFGEQLYFLPEEAAFPLEGLKILRPGLHVGTCRKNRFEPAHALALRLSKEDAAFSIRLPLHSDSGTDRGSGSAEAYLRGQTIPFAEGKGWRLVLAEDFPIGWGKIADGILKNHYPRGLRWV